MSSANEAELTHWLKKIAGKYERQKGIRAYSSGGDHVFVPNQTFDDSGGTIVVNSFVNKIKVPNSSSAEAKVNFDRPVTDNEFSTIFPGTGETYGRICDYVFIEAPSGQTTTVNVEAIKMTE